MRDPKWCTFSCIELPIIKLCCEQGCVLLDEVFGCLSNLKLDRGRCIVWFSFEVFHVESEFVCGLFL
jgi:hypothetical protein